jgi:hypothetical protein
MLDMLGLDEYDEEHLPHGDLTDAQEPEGPQMIREIHHYRVFLGEFRLLPTDHDHVVHLWLREYLIHLEYLLLPVHIESHRKHPELSRLTQHGGGRFWHAPWYLLS